MASDGLMSYWKSMITLILQILSISGCESETEYQLQDNQYHSSEG